MAAMRAHASYPTHYTPVVPNPKKVKSASTSSSVASKSPPTGGVTPQPSDRCDEEGEATTTLLRTAAEMLVVEGNLTWPEASRRHVIKGDVSPSSVYYGAEWYACFSCSVMGSGCPGRLIAMRMKEGRGDRSVIRVIFKADCVHRHDSTSTTQLRGAQRQDLIQSATRAPASLHANASAVQR